MIYSQWIDVEDETLFIWFFSDPVYVCEWKNKYLNPFLLTRLRPLKGTLELSAENKWNLTWLKSQKVELNWPNLACSQHGSHILSIQTIGVWA